MPPGRGSACAQALLPGRRHCAGSNALCGAVQSAHPGDLVRFPIRAVIRSVGVRGERCFDQALLHQPQQIDQLA